MCAQAEDWRIGGKANDQWSHVWMELWTRDVDVGVDVDVDGDTM